jgi:hypothetical protein
MHDLVSEQFIYARFMHIHPESGASLQAPRKCDALISMEIKD